MVLVYQCYNIENHTSKTNLTFHTFRDMCPERSKLPSKPTIVTPCRYKEQLHTCTLTPAAKAKIHQLHTFNASKLSYLVSTADGANVQFWLFGTNFSVNCWSKWIKIIHSAKFHRTRGMQSESSNFPKKSFLTKNEVLSRYTCLLGY